jgi:hypothetical protein
VAYEVGIISVKKTDCRGLNAFENRAELTIQKLISHADKLCNWSFECPEYFWCYFGSGSGVGSGMGSGIGISLGLGGGC